MFNVLAALLLMVWLGQSPGHSQRKDMPQEPKKVDRPPLTDMRYEIGEIRRVVKGDESPLIHIGMAWSGSTIIEWPADEHYFGAYVSEIGDWVRMEESPTRKTDNHLVLRPGKDLPTSDSPALVQLQLRSGLVVTLCVHGTKFAGAQTRRVVLLYNRDEIVAARRKAGLAVNLGPEERPRTTAPVTTPSPQAAEEKPAIKVSPTPTAEEKAAKLAAEKKAEADAQLSKALTEALKRAEAQPKKLFEKWSKTTHGLSVATRTYDLNEETRIALVAIRNVEDRVLRIMPGHPELVIETQNEKGRVVQLNSVPKRLEETTTTSQLIPGGKTVYYAIAYRPPIMTTNQKLRVTVGQQAASDEPAAADITTWRDK
jgi:hypothetical protein